jgi:hypothetical protein
MSDTRHCHFYASQAAALLEGRLMEAEREIQIHHRAEYDSHFHLETLAPNRNCSQYRWCGAEGLLISAYKQKR